MKKFAKTARFKPLSILLDRKEKSDDHKDDGKKHKGVLKGISDFSREHRLSKVTDKRGFAWNADKSDDDTLRYQKVWDVTIQRNKAGVAPMKNTHKKRKCRIIVEVHALFGRSSDEIDSKSLQEDINDEDEDEDITTIKLIKHGSREIKKYLDVAQVITEKSLEFADHKAEKTAKIISEIKAGKTAKIISEIIPIHKHKGQLVRLGHNDADDGRVNNSDDGQDNVDHDTADWSEDESPDELGDENLSVTTKNHSDDWYEEFSFQLRQLVLDRCSEDVCTVTVTSKKKTTTEDITFQNKEEAAFFYDFITKRKELEARHVEQNILDIIGNDVAKRSEKINILVDIVGAVGLKISDITSSDPYCIVRRGENIIHQTKFISKSLNPIWTIETKSLFVLTLTIEELFQNYEGLCFELQDFDSLSSHDFMGAVFVHPRTVYLGRGERIELYLKNLPGMRKTSVKGKLAVRFRRATQDDLEFMKSFNDSEKQRIQYPKLLTKKPLDQAVAMVTKNTHKTHGVKRHRIRPNPDPNRELETSWMTKEEIEKEVYDKPCQWIQAGSGKIGRVYVEILGCDHLNNTEIGVGINGVSKSDAFVAAVFEDCYVVTDTISECLSPRWLPWMQRAFFFNISHPSSPLYLGVFDFDTGFDHDPIGRISVDITTLPHNTDCVLYYNLYKSARNTQPTRTSQGTITIRVRVELDHQQEALLSNLKIPPRFYINCKGKKDFKVLKYACDGNFNVHKYSLNTITKHLEEIESYQLIWIYIQYALLQLLLWRKFEQITLVNPFQPRVTQTHEIKNSMNQTPNKETITLSVPIHSILAFIMGITLIEKPNLIPSFFFASLAWVMLGTSSYRRNNPSPWRRCELFQDLIVALVLGGKSVTESQTIEPNQNKDAIDEVEKFWMEQFSVANEEAAKRAKANEQKQIEYEAQEEILDITAREKKKVQIGKAITDIDPFKKYLYPIQILLEQACKYLRCVRNIITWKETYFAFWITFGSLVLAVYSLYIPWGHLIVWSSRLLVWTLLGPWMKLLDIYYVRPLELLTEEEKSELQKKKKVAEGLSAEYAQEEARIQIEEATKLREWRKYIYGKYSMRVNVINLDRHLDNPLPQSYTFEATRSQTYRSTKIIHGQKLDGKMIPKRS